MELENSFRTFDQKSSPLAELRHWPEFVAAVEASNAFLRPGALRRYQAEILSRGEFKVVSPHTGAPAITRSTAKQAPPGQIAYFFQGPPCFWLLTPRGKFMHGHALSQVIFEDGSSRQNLSGPNWPDISVATEQFQRLRGSPSETSPTHPGPPTLVIGHINFAHHLWNELGALQAWLCTASDQAIEKLSVIAVAEPLGPLEEIFPRLSSARIYRGKGKTPEINLKVRVGSCLVTSPIRETLRSYCALRGNTLAAQKVLGEIGGRHPVVWLSVRQNSRTPDNQLAFLRAVIRCILGVYDDAIFVVDGFSFPVDFFVDARTIDERALFSARSKDASTFVRSLRDEISRELGPDPASRLLDISGLNLTEAIHIGGHCDYYICHSGTLQHKIAWFHDVPGFIHTTPRDYHYAQRYAKHVEDGVAPDILPPGFSVSTSSPDFRQDIPRNYNYRIVDEEKAAAAILGSMQQHLSGSLCA